MTSLPVYHPRHARAQPRLSARGGHPAAEADRLGGIPGAPGRQTEQHTCGGSPGLIRLHYSLWHLRLQARQEVQPLRVVASGLHSEHAVVLGAKEGHWSDLPGLEPHVACACACRMCMCMCMCMCMHTTCACCTCMHMHSACTHITAADLRCARLEGAFACTRLCTCM